MVITDSEGYSATPALPPMLRDRRHAGVGAGLSGGAPCTGADTKSFPAQPCAGGIRTTITFPTCWDGKNVDSPDHKIHVAYPQSGTFESVGQCPSTHPVRLPQLMYEVMWDVSAPLSPHSVSLLPFVNSRRTFQRFEIYQLAYIS